MDSSALPLILIELVLVFGGVMAFGWWQLRSVARDRQKAAAERAEQARKLSSEADAEAGPPAPGNGA
jgi:F0F1-type ATP synthase membrane subunit b/b'